MHHLFIALFIGIVAGVIDVIPMILQKMDKSANLSAFTHWVVLGLIIPFVSWNMAPYLKGLIIAEISAVPILLLVVPKDKKALAPITLMSAKTAFKNSNDCFCDRWKSFLNWNGIILPMEFYLIV